MSIRDAKTDREGDRALATAAPSPCRWGTEDRVKRDPEIRAVRASLPTNECPHVKSAGAPGIPCEREWRLGRGASSLGKPIERRLDKVVNRDIEYGCPIGQPPESVLRDAHI
jgi:hypothetical protein